MTDQKQSLHAFVKRIYTYLTISLVLLTVLTTVIFLIIDHYTKSILDDLCIFDLNILVLTVPFILPGIILVFIRDSKKRWAPALSVILLNIEILVSSILLAQFIFCFNVVFPKSGIAIVVSVYTVVLGMFGITSYLGLHGNVKFNAHQYAWKFFSSSLLAGIMAIIFKFNWLTLIADALVIISAPFFMINTAQKIKKDFHTAQFLKNDLPMVIDIVDTMLLEIMLEFTNILHFLMTDKDNNDAN